MVYDPSSTLQCRSEISQPYLPSLTSHLGQLIASLPQELVSNIFIWVCNVEPTSFVDPTYSTKQALYLSHVSGLWRSIALQTPRLWTNLQVVIRGANVEPALELIKLWVPRSMSRSLLIGVNFEDCRRRYLAFPEDTLTLFRVITKAAALLKNVQDHRTLDEAYFETHIRAGSFGVVPLLEERYLWFSGVSWPPTADEKPSLPLTVLGRWQAVDEFGSDFHSRFSTSLTKLDLQDTNGITCVSNTEVLIIIDEFPFLRHLSAYINLGNSPPSEIVVAKHLKSLHLSWLYITDVGPLLDELVAPNLTELRMSGEIPAGGQWNHLWNFFQRSKPPIEQLSLQEIDGRTSRLSDCLSLLPNLETLWLDFCILEDSFLYALNRRPALGDFKCDRLKTLGIVSCENISGDSLLQAFKRNYTTSLRELYVFDCPGVTEAHCEVLRQRFAQTDVVFETLESPVETSG